MTGTNQPESAFERAHRKIKLLAETFQANEESYTSSNYQEVEVRKDFIDKFFIALGWDVNHDEQTNPWEQEVKVEPPVRAAGQRRADYAFHLAPNYRDTRFFVEAKKPFGDIATADNYFQIIRYAWNTDTPLSALTDFKQFHVLDCRYKPNVDTSLQRHVARYHYSDYFDREKFAEIYWLFSREAVASGALERRAKELPKPRGKAVQRGLFPGGYQSIDESFLEQLDKYRTSLARVFKNKNTELDSETLTEIVQRILDRLVFLRFLEDKSIEPQPIIDLLGKRGTAWEDFVAASRRLDGIYNGIVFKYHSLLDGQKLQIDDTTFADICDSLAHVNSPYDFDAIPIHILGSIYERFLGNVIIATDKRVRVEPKPEVRKARGVYYTPEYIVRHIVENTVGKLIEGKSPEEIAKMRFADVACGSGSFLLGVFDCLLEYHTRYYSENPKKARKSDCISHDGRLYLSLGKKREILCNNIYGVDLDAQAVEVCQLSLYLKLLQEETTGSARQYQLDFAHQIHMKKLLPDLRQNIICGNSLIGSDILDGLLFAGEEERKVNPMDFEDAFPDVMKQGGFDAIIGNPPYIQLSMKAFRNDDVNRYLKDTYKFSGGRLNTFAFFIERARQKTREGGKFSYIVPNTVLSQEYYTDLRKNLLSQTEINSIVLPDGQVFKDAVVETAILIMTKHTRKEIENPKSTVTFTKLQQRGMIEMLATIPQASIAENYKASFITSSRPELQQIKAKLDKAGRCLGEWVSINQAIALKHDRAACLTDSSKTARHKEILDGRHINRYYTGKSSNYFKFDLSRIHSCKREDIFLLKEKIFFRRVGDRLIGSIDTEKKYALNTIVVISPKENCLYDLRFILGLFNSKLLNFYYLNFLKSTKKVFSEIQARQVAQLPLPLLDLSSSDGLKHHNLLVARVNAIQQAFKLLLTARTDKERGYYESRCATLDRQIDRLVYELYELSEDEIQTVERTGESERNYPRQSRG